MERKIILTGEAGAALLQQQQLFAEAFRQQRQMQYDDDRMAVLRSLDIAEWQRFCLRWNIPPPFPKGWGDEDAQFAVMHKTRLMLGTFTAEEKRFSAAVLIGGGHALPPGLTYEDGEVKGVAHGPGPIAN